MPNWTKNEVSIRGEQEPIDTFREAVRGKNGPLDFNSLEPMPERLAIEDGSRTEAGLAYVRLEGAWTGQMPDAKVIALGRQALQNIEQYGFPTWYDWRGEHWGTKWNACEAHVEEYTNSVVYCFNTAWDAPRPLVSKIVDLAYSLGLLVVWDVEHEYDGSEVIVEE
ncbi:MAG TPA: hypothetical protein VMV29_19130 [Ktedonobacterales bacterium]|nr:hypothetical protein [Ktedonobacterales bacterium]